MKKIPLYFSTVALMALPIVGWGATITGTVLSGAPATVASTPVVGATVILSSYGQGSQTPLYTATTDNSGNYSFPNAPVGPLSVSATAPQFSPGFIALAVNSSDTTLQENFSLTDSTLTGNIKSDANIFGTITAGGVALVNTKILLRRRATATGTTSNYVIVDSAYSDVNGVFVFDSILAVGTGLIANAYTLVVNSFTDSANSYALFTSGNLTVADGVTLQSNIALTATGVRPVLATDKVQGIQFSVSGDKLLLDLGTSSASRTVSIYGTNGALQRQLSVAGGESRVTLPASYAPSNGFLFRVK
jgi:hypothetical protein